MTIWTPEVKATPTLAIELRDSEEMWQLDISLDYLGTEWQLQLCFAPSDGLDLMTALRLVCQGAAEHSL